VVAHASAMLGIYSRPVPAGEVSGVGDESADLVVEDRFTIVPGWLLDADMADSVDRAMKELVGIGAVRVEHRYDGAQRLTNAYHVRTSRPRPTKPPSPRCEGSRKSAATPPRSPRDGSDAVGQRRRATDRQTPS